MFARLLRRPCLASMLMFEKIAGGGRTQTLKGFERKSRAHYQSTFELDDRGLQSIDPNRNDMRPRPNGHVQGLTKTVRYFVRSLELLGRLG